MPEIDQEHVGQFNRRFGVRLDDGSRVECVLYRGDTLCVSCQVGCAVGCPFCASGANGFSRNLSLDELEFQVASVRARGHRIARLTVSGIGEPLHNLDVVEAFVGQGRAAKTGVSLTTSGGPVSRLGRLLRSPHNGVTVSVHAGTDAVRAQMVPRGPALDVLFAALEHELSTLSRSRCKKVALAYLVIAGLNDHEAELDAFGERASRLPLDVHLYAYNPVATSQARPVTRARYEQIYEHLRALRLTVRMSSRARIESNGGCGTLLALRPSHAQGPAHAVAGVDLDAGAQG